MSDEKVTAVIGLNGHAHHFNAVRYVEKRAEGVQSEMVKLSCGRVEMYLDVEEFLAIADAVRDAPPGPLMDFNETVWTSSNSIISKFSE